MKCFGCGKEGHLIRLCPGRAGAPGPPACLGWCWGLCPDGAVERHTRFTGGGTSEDSLTETQENLQEDVKSLYTSTSIRKFLHHTKGTRLVRVEDFFPVSELFLKSVKYHMEKSEGTDQPTFTD
ncbi:unnamed protein product [Pleuronectes platessa]|uniref:CCHC-type domain-containing protein n=1 Tax=Pleuronectes platessa TaxID=8262 RepID=A0A9N7UVC0_PLEPL|nr:unnamed protein product [Pleuronectes platessa]